MRFEVKTIKEPNRMISYWKNQWLLVMGITIAGIIYNCGLAVGPVIQGKIIDFITGGMTDKILPWIGIFVGTIALVQACRYCKRYGVRIFANRTSATMRNMVYKSIVERDVQDLKDEKTGDLMTKGISDVDGCVEGMRKFTTEIFDTGVVMVAYFVTMASYSLKITVLSVLFVPIAMFIAERLKTVVYKYSKAYRSQLSKVAEMTNENIANELLYRVNSVEGFAAEHYSKELEDLEKKAVRANVLETAMQPIYRVVALLGLLVIVYVCGTMVARGQWTVGDFAAYVAIFIDFAAKASKSGKLFNSVQKAQVSWQRIKPYLNGVRGESVGKAEAGISGGADAHGVAGPITLRVEDLCFRKVSHASFEISTGELLGVTGPIASGKSLIGMALQGLWQYDGSININGKELRDMTSAQISKYIAYMGHDSQLLSDTIYNNITLGGGDSGKSEGFVERQYDDIAQVIRDVDFEEDLKAMPDGINTMVGPSGVRLSGGQQARLALARALYNKSRILVLDDPFSAVDVATEKRIIENIKKNYADSAIVLISHRVSAFNNAEKVLLVEDGKTTFDTHQNLMETSETYREIFSLQAEPDMQNSLGAEKGRQEVHHE